MRGCRLTESKITLLKGKSYESESFVQCKIVGNVWVKSNIEEVPTSVVKNANQFGLQPSNIGIDTNKPSTSM